MIPTPKTGLNRDQYHRYAWNDGDWQPGITTVIGMKDKPFLIPWSKRLTAKAAVHNYKTLGEMIARDGEQATIDHLVNLSEMERDRAAAAGSRIHEYAEMMGAGKPLPILPASDLKKAEAYAQWWEKNQPKFVEIEYMVYSEQWLYGGTGDAIIENEKGVGYIDYKTGNIKPEDAMQLAAAEGADFIGKEGDPEKYPLPKADWYGILQIREDEAEMVPYNVTPTEFEAFLNLRAIKRWDAERKKVIMPPDKYKYR